MGRWPKTVPYVADKGHLDLPVIGVPTRRLRVSGRDDYFLGLFKSYLSALSDAGAVPVLIPPSPQMLFAASRCDAFLLAGGDDPVCPEWWELGNAPRGQSDPERDATEADIVHFAHNRKMPILGICRGMQVVNCVLGGTLSTINLASAQVPHGRDRDTDADSVHHLRVVARSVLGSIAPSLAVENVISRHGAQVFTVGRELVPVAWAPDGVIEALEGHGWDFLGVQWHPEMTARDVHSGPAIFRWLVDRAKSKSGTAR